MSFEFFLLIQLSFVLGTSNNESTTTGNGATVIQVQVPGFISFYIVIFII
jgi:hypothetical protein